MLFQVVFCAREMVEQRTGKLVPEYFFVHRLVFFFDGLYHQAVNILNRKNDFFFHVAGTFQLRFDNIISISRSRPDSCSRFLEPRVETISSHALNEFLELMQRVREGMDEVVL